MDGYSWIALLTFIAIALAVYKVRKRKDYKYSLLDISSIILNIVLLVLVYPPLCVAGALLEIGHFATTPMQALLEGIAIVMGRLMPAVCVAGVGASILLRRKERSVMSFWTQFAGGFWFAITMLIGKLSGSY